MVGVKVEALTVLEEDITINFSVGSQRVVVDCSIKLLGHEIPRVLIDGLSNNAFKLLKKTNNKILLETACSFSMLCCCDGRISVAFSVGSHGWLVVESDVLEPWPFVTLRTFIKLKLTV